MNRDEPNNHTQQPSSFLADERVLESGQLSIQPTLLHAPDCAESRSNNSGGRAADGSTISLNSRQSKLTIDFASSPEGPAELSPRSSSDATELWTQSSNQQYFIENLPVVPGYEIKGVLG